MISQIDAPVSHITYEGIQEQPKAPEYKTFSANFNRHQDRHQNNRKSHHGRHSRSSRDKYCRLKRLCKEYNQKICARDHQIQVLKEKILSLHRCNEEFALENDKLRSHVQSLTDYFDKNQKSSDEQKLDSSSQIEKYKCDNYQLRQDLNMMKILVYRLNVQLEHYQGKSSHQQSMHSESAVDRSLNWGSVNTHTLAPLLNALSQSIYEKSELIKKCEETMNTFTWRMKEILMENEYLHKKMQDAKYLKNHILIWKNRSDTLLEKNELLKEKLTEILTCYENKMQSMAMQFDALNKMCSKTEQDRSSTKLDPDPELIKLRESLNNSAEEYTKLKKDHEELNKKHKTQKSLCEKYIKQNNVLQVKLEQALSWKRVYRCSQEAVKSSQQNVWRDINKMEKIINSKDIELQKALKRYNRDVQRLQNDLVKKEKYLQNILDKFRNHLRECTRQKVLQHKLKATVSDIKG